MKNDTIIKTVCALSLTSSLFFTAFPTPSSYAAEGRPDVIDVKKIASYSTGLTDKDGGVAEIVKYNKDNKKFYVINGKNQTVDIVSLKDLHSNEIQNLQKEKSINIADAINTETFQYGDLTSIDINTNKGIIAAAVQDKDYSKNGRIVIMDYDGKILESFEAGVQPDNVEISEDGSYILSANEGEPSMGLENGVDPEGSVTIIKYDTKQTTTVLFDDSSVIEDDVHIRNKTGGAKVDLEPEYLAFSADGKKAYVSLQENNSIGSIDIENGKVLSVRSLGYKDHSLSENVLDAARNDKVEFEQLPILGVYMPDSIASVEINGVEYLLTANEGDATDWEEFVNIEDFKKVKDNIQLDPSLFKGLSPEEVESTFERMKTSKDYDKLEVLTDHGNNAIYTLGGRSFSLWNANTLELVYDSGSDFEQITAERLPEVFNWSNDDDVFEKRSAKKGPEPEDIKVGTIGNELFAFIGLERIGGVMTYNISNPNEITFANYINTRDFSGAVAGDVAPEGQDFVPAEDSPTGKPLLLVGNEVSGTVAVNEYQVEPIISIEKITLDTNSATVKVGETVKLQAMIQPENTTDNKELLWTSTDEKVATVTNDGLVTAIAEGTTTIFVETTDKTHRAEATIIVQAIEEDPTVPDPNDDNNEEPNSPAPTDDNNEDPNLPAPNDNNNGNPNSPVPTGNDKEESKTDTNKNNNANTENKTGNELPNTATTSYSMLLYGGILTVIGGIFFGVYHRLRIKEY